MAVPILHPHVFLLCYLYASGAFSAACLAAWHTFSVFSFFFLFSFQLVNVQVTPALQHGKREYDGGLFWMFFFLRWFWRTVCNSSANLRLKIDSLPLLLKPTTLSFKSKDNNSRRRRRRHWPTGGMRRAARQHSPERTSLLLSILQWSLHSTYLNFIFFTF